MITGVDMNRKKILYFYPDHHEEVMRNVSIRTAVRISMGIPWVFEPVEFNGGLCVDGGVLDKYPIHAFDGEYPGDPVARLNLCPANPEVLGLNIVSVDDLDNVYGDKR